MDIILPVEMAQRELDSKIKLALELTKFGHTVAIGEKHMAINYALATKGCVFYSIWGAHKKFISVYRKMKSRGISIILSDEESFVTLGDNIFTEIRLNKECLEYADMYMALGKHDANLVSNVNSALKVVVAGNPRVDILKNHKSDRTASKTRLLFVSPFGFCSHFKYKDKYLDWLIDRNVISRTDHIDLYRRYHNFQTKNYMEFVKLMQRCSALYPSLEIVYRCHPAEDSKSIEKHLRGTSIKVSNESCLSKDLNESSLVIHNFCTVGIEARIMGRDTLAYSPYLMGVSDEQYIYDQTKFASDINSAIQYINIHLENKGNVTEYRSNERIYIPTQEGGSAARIANCIDNYYTNEKPNSKFIISPSLVKSTLRRYIKRDRDYFAHRGAGLNIEAIQNEIDRKNLQNGVQVRKSIYPDIFILKSK